MSVRFIENFYFDVESSHFRSVLHDERPWSFQNPYTYPSTAEDDLGTLKAQLKGAMQGFFFPSILESHYLSRYELAFMCWRVGPSQIPQARDFPCFGFLLFEDKSGPVCCMQSYHRLFSIEEFDPRLPSCGTYDTS